jgi:hypothetical protein
MKRTIAVTGLLFVLSATALAESQDAPAVRSYPVSGHGVLKLAVPAAWTDRVEGEKGLPPTIKLKLDGGKTILLITALWSPQDEAEFNSSTNICAGIQRASMLVQETAVEKELVLRPIGTSSGEGHFFWATDREPGAGEHKYMANGGVPAGKLLLTFTVLSHVEPPRGIEEALAIVRSASHEP